MPINSNDVGWATNLLYDPVTNRPNREQVPDELRLSGLYRYQALPRPFINQILYQHGQALLTLQQDFSTDVDTITSQLNTLMGFGLGDSLPDPIDDFNNVGSLGTGFYRTINGSLNNPLDVVQGNLLNMRRETGAFGEIDGSQLLLGETTTGDKIAAFRFEYDVNASTVPFIELYHTDNAGTFQNSSGSTIISNTIVAGSSLTPAVAGSWKNACGNDIVNGGSGWMVKV